MIEPLFAKRRDNGLAIVVFGLGVAFALVGALTSRTPATGLAGASVPCAALGCALSLRKSALRRFAFVLLLSLFIPMCVGFVLTAMSVRLDHTSASWSLFLICLAGMLGSGTLRLVTQGKPQEGSLPANMQSPTAQHDDNRRKWRSGRWGSVAVASACVGAILAAAIVISYVSDNRYQKNQGFVSLSVSNPDDLSETSREISLRIANTTTQRSAGTLQVIQNDRVVQMLNIVVPSESTVDRIVEAPPNMSVRVEYVGNEGNTDVTRSVVLRSVIAGS